jgi:hypothetical protein
MDRVALLEFLRKHRWAVEASPWSNGGLETAGSRS